jgi:hypothetical protein
VIRKRVLDSTAVDIIDPFKRKLDYVRLARKGGSPPDMNEKSGDDLGVHHIGQKILIMSNPRSLGLVFDVGGIVRARGDSGSGLESPQPAHHASRMFLVIANGMGHTRRINKLADGPPIFPMNPAVGIANHHEINTRLMNGKESMDHIDRPWESSGDQNDIGTGRQTSHHGLCHIGSIVDIDLPCREIPTGQVDILKHSGVIPRILGAIEAEGKGIYHGLLIDYV